MGLWMFEFDNTLCKVAKVNYQLQLDMPVHILSKTEKKNKFRWFLKCKHSNSLIRSTNICKMF